MTKQSGGWSAEYLKDIPPFKETWSKGWRSVRHHFGILGFGVNAVTKSEGEALTPEHDEKKSGQQELFYVVEGLAIFTLDGEQLDADSGMFVEVEPSVRRKIVAGATPTTIILMGGAPGKVYEPPSYEKIE